MTYQEKEHSTATPQYQIVVGNIGTVYYGSNRAQAEHTYKEYVSQSKSNYGRAGGETVTMLKHGEIVREHVGSLDADRLFCD